MATSVKVVTAYVDLGLTKRPSAEFHALGDKLVQACRNIRVFREYPLHECWVPREFSHIKFCANKRAEDRFVTDAEHLRSNMIQHSPMQWVREAYMEDPVCDVYVWMGYSLLKQGDFTGKRITQEHVTDFIGRLEAWDPKGIPLPGITGKAPVSIHGDNWRFCGSVLVVPRQHILGLGSAYRTCAREFIRRHQCIPLDLAIWPTVEELSGLPIRWYPAEYDYTQLTNFPFNG